MSRAGVSSKYIFVMGGVMSGIGKGITTASIGKILQDRGFIVTAIKIDPYINLDAGTMNPIEHGEVFVTEDGLECDQDIGNYERFLDSNINADNYLTTGLVYDRVIRRERNLEYNGKCVEVIPHIPEEAIQTFKRVARRTKADFILVEIGGTAGEYQNLIFLEAARMMHLRQPDDVLFVLVSYLPVPSMVGEMKTKPTQYAVRTLNSAGIQPDIIIARSEYSLDDLRKEKISIFCNMHKEDIISAPDIQTIYEVPLNFEKDNLSQRILNKFNLRSRRVNNYNIGRWKKLIKIIKSAKKEVKIALVGKYFETGNFILSDSYISVIEAVKHAAWHYGYLPRLTWLNAEIYEKNSDQLKELRNFDGLIVPGGFGSRGAEGKIKAIEFCRKNKIPFLGLCYGMQLAVVEFARNMAGLKAAHTTEVNLETKEPVISLLTEQAENLREKKYGGSMRLGACFCHIYKNTRVYQFYKQSGIFERHRHRYEFNNRYRNLLEAKGLVFSGFNPERNLVEMIEIKNHPFFVGAQFHPEFKSRPLKPHPLFRELIRAAISSGRKSN